MAKDIQSVVQSKYASVAASDLTNESPGVSDVAEAFGYSPDELRSIPAAANMGLSCGNPTAFASIKPGEVVVDLGCGGGLDVFLASQKVGPSGRAIDIDMTPEMIERARKNAATGSNGQPIQNVEFKLGAIDKLPLPESSADCIISNCVINLAPDKRAVFREMFRVLKPGGRVAISDIALKQTLPAELERDVMAYVGCIAGAISIDEYDRGLTAAGFSAVHVVDSGSDLNAYSKVEGQSGCCSPTMPASTSLPIAASSCCGGNPCGPSDGPSVHAGLATVLDRYNINDYAASVKVYAVKRK
jgi:SAM-dependent methyltransferase